MFGKRRLKGICDLVPIVNSLDEAEQGFTHWFEACSIQTDLGSCGVFFVNFLLNTLLEKCLQVSMS